MRGFIYIYSRGTPPYEKKKKESIKNFIISVRVNDSSRRIPPPEKESPGLGGDRARRRRPEGEDWAPRVVAFAKGLGPGLGSGTERPVRQKAAGTVRKNIAHSDGGVMSLSFSGRGCGGDGQEHETLRRRHHGEARAAGRGWLGPSVGRGG